MLFALPPKRAKGSKIPHTKGESRKSFNAPRLKIMNDEIDKKTFLMLTNGFLLSEREGEGLTMKNHNISVLPLWEK